MDSPSWSIVVSRTVHDGPRWVHGRSMNSPWWSMVVDGQSMVVHGGSTVDPCWVQTESMIGPWNAHGGSMESPWWFNGESIVVHSGLCTAH